MTRHFALLLAAVCVACEGERHPDDAAVASDSGVAVDSATGSPGDADPTRATTPATPTTAATPTTSAGGEAERALRAALDARVRGAAPQVDSLGFSWFSGATADVIRSVHLDEGGRAVVDLVDLRAVLPNASSSAGSEALLRELNATVFGVAGVRAVEYRMAGSCELLGEWLQYGTCLRFDRPAS